MNWFNPIVKPTVQDSIFMAFLQQTGTFMLWYADSYDKTSQSSFCSDIILVSQIDVWSREQVEIYPS